MSYLDETIQEIKERIMNSYYWCLRTAKTAEEVGEQMKELESFLKEKLVQSFKNGIEVGKKGKQGTEPQKTEKTEE